MIKLKIFQGTLEEIEEAFNEWSKTSTTLAIQQTLFSDGVLLVFYVVVTEELLNAMAPRPQGPTPKVIVPNMRLVPK